MSLVFSAIVPHSPFLIPSIGKENTEQIKDTISSYKKLEEDLYSSKAETIIVISPHGTIQPNYFTLNLSPEFTTNLEDFGDMVTKIKFNCDIGFAHRIRERMETRAPLQLISEPNLDYGSGVPLILLTEHLPNIKIIPIYYSGLDLEAHLKFGQLLKREIMINKERVAVVASGDLSHKLSKDAPAGFSPKAKKFDKKIIEYLTKHKTSEILQFKNSQLAEVSECGLKSIVMLLGIMSEIKYEPKLLSYEAPFGVGYLTMNLEL